MNYICFSPNFPPNFYQFAVALKKYGVNVLGIGDAPYEFLHDGLKWAFTEYYKVDDLHRFDQLEQAMEHLIKNHGPIDGIDSHNEYWLETEARLRTKYQIDGLKNQDMGKTRKKSEMKRLFQKAGLEVARGKLVKSISDEKKLIEQTGYPVIAKPNMGVGAADIFKIKNENDLRHFFDVKPGVEYILEEFIAGEVFSFDGLVDKKGELVFYSSFQYADGVMEVVHNDAHTYYYTLRDIPKELIEAGKKILKAYKVRGRFFHFEFFREFETGRFVALEVNMRPPGGFSAEMFNYTMDVDIYLAWAAMIAAEKYDVDYSKKYNVSFVSRKWKYNYRYSNEELLARFGNQIVLSQQMEEVLARAMGNHCYLVRSENLEEVLKIQEIIHQTI